MSAVLREHLLRVAETVVPSPDGLDRIRSRIANPGWCARTTRALAAATARALKPLPTNQGATPMTITPNISRPGIVHERIMIDGADVTGVALTGHPECVGLRVPDHGPAYGRIEDGPFSIDTDDLDEALRWRNAWQQLVSHLQVEQQRIKRLAETQAVTDEGEVR